MNSFTNTILSLLLSWIRALVSNIWSLLNSEGSGALYQFLSAHWKAIVLILCVGGFLVDRIIYIIRWRPYYVWSSKLGRLRRGREQEPDYDDVYDDDEPIGSFPATPDEPVTIPPAYPEAAPTTAYAPLRTADAPLPGAYAPPVHVPIAPVQPIEPVQPIAPVQATARYAPLAQSMSADHVPYRQPYTPPADLEPVFDDEPAAWEQGEALVRPLTDAYQNPAEGMVQSFGAAKPEPVDYIRDMQAGFAPQLPPEQLYKPKPAAEPIEKPAPEPAPEPIPEPIPEVKAPVHPGLGNEAFRQNFGLSPAGTLNPDQEDDDDYFKLEEDADIAAQTTTHVPTFMPYALPDDDRQDEQSRMTRRNPFAGIAKKARDLVGGEDEEHRPTIHDLQPTVDMRSAFHEPVYPQPKDDKGGDL